MSRYIEEDHLIVNIYFHADDDGYICCPVEVLEEIIKEEPTADVRENTHGKWLRTPMACYGGGTITEFECSACGEHQIVESNFCPNCGADCRGEEE